MNPANGACFTGAGIDCCVLANNHVLDWGPAGLDETLATLHAAGLRTAGAGRDLIEAAQPAVMEIDALQRVLVFGFATPDSGTPESWGAGARRGAFAHRLVDAGGADIVWGHSSHHVKGIEVRGGKLILYGCGDLINDYEGIAGHDEYRGDLSLMHFPEIDCMAELAGRSSSEPTLR